MAKLEADDQITILMHRVSSYANAVGKHGAD